MPSTPLKEKTPTRLLFAVVRNMHHLLVCWHFLVHTRTRTRTHVHQIWSVGLRGLNDYAYPNCKENDPGPTGCGEIISQAIENQTQLLMAATGKSLEQLDFKFNLWTEALGM
jgi:hypothetical protein